MDSKHIQLNIPLSFKQLVDIVRQLSPSEKEKLGELLWSEQNTDDLVIPETQKEMVRERIKKYEDSPGSYLSWDEIDHKMTTDE